MGKHEDDLEQAQIDLAAAQTALAQQELESEKIETQRKELFAFKEQRRLELDEAEAEHHRVYTFTGGVDGLKVETAIDEMAGWARHEPGCPITVRINSQGGNVFEGLALYDFLRGLSEDGHEITTVGMGMAASMGGILLQAGDIRVLTPNAFVLIHEVSSLGIGSVTDLKDEVKLLEQLQDRCVDILTARSKLTKKKIRENWTRKDWWIASEDCANLKIVDRIGWS